MSFINWSDSHEMLGLLAEFVADERQESAYDPARRRFLTGVLEELRELTGRIEEMNDDELVAGCQMILEPADGEFSSDPVVEHIQACMEELERIRDRSIDRKK